MVDPGEGHSEALTKPEASKLKVGGSSILVGAANKWEGEEKHHEGASQMPPGGHEETNVADHHCSSPHKKKPTNYRERQFLRTRSTKKGRKEDFIPLWMPASVGLEAGKKGEWKGNISSLLLQKKS